MSRIGKKHIDLPEKVKFTLSSGCDIQVEGPKGKLTLTLPEKVKVNLDGNRLVFERENDARATRAAHGLARALVANMVTGVSTGFVKDLEIQGVGFKAAVQGQILNLNLGYSHPLHFEIPKEINISVADNTKIKIEGIDKQVVGQVAADIRAYYPPEPYKGKGVRYAGEKILRKEGKTVQ